MQRFRIAQRVLGATVATASLVAVAAVGAYAALSDSTADTTTASQPSPSPTEAGQSQDAHAIVVNHGDNRFRYALTLKVVQVSGSVVDPQNAAVAVASDCTGCETVAISLEGVLVYGDPSVFAPENFSLAYNQNCTNCTTAALAYQEVVQHGDKVRITGAGRQEIAAIRRDLESIRHSDMSLAAIDAEVNADAAELRDVLQNDVVQVGKPVPNNDSTASPSPTTDMTTDSASPAASPQDSSSGSSSASPSSSDSSSPSDSPTPTDSPSSPSASPSPTG